MGCIRRARATLSDLSENNGSVYHKNKIAKQLEKGLEDAIKDTRTEAIVQGVGSGGSQLLFTNLERILSYR